MDNFCKRNSAAFDSRILCMRCCHKLRRAEFEETQSLSPVLLDEVTPRCLFGAGKDRLHGKGMKY